MHDLSGDPSAHVDATGTEVVARHVVVAGRVQGVFFRRSLADEADRHGVVGWVRNLPDGRVEAHLEGEPDAVATVEAWAVGGGPRDAEVVDATTTDATPEGHPAFGVR